GRVLGCLVACVERVQVGVGVVSIGVDGGADDDAPPRLGTSVLFGGQVLGWPGDRLGVVAVPGHHQYMAWQRGGVEAATGGGDSPEPVDDLGEVAECPGGFGRACEVVAAGVGRQVAK